MCSVAHFSKAARVLIWTRLPLLLLKDISFIKTHNQKKMEAALKCIVFQTCRANREAPPMTTAFHAWTCDVSLAKKCVSLRCRGLTGLTELLLANKRIGFCRQRRVVHCARILRGPFHLQHKLQKQQVSILFLERCFSK